MVWPPLGVIISGYFLPRNKHCCGDFDTRSIPQIGSWGGWLYRFFQEKLSISVGSDLFGWGWRPPCPSHACYSWKGDGGMTCLWRNGIVKWVPQGRGQKGRLQDLQGLDFLLQRVLHPIPSMHEFSDTSQASTIRLEVRRYCAGHQFWCQGGDRMIHDQTGSDMPMTRSGPTIPAGGSWMWRYVGFELVPFLLISWLSI